MYRSCTVFLLISALIFTACIKRSDETSGEPPVQPDPAVTADNFEKPQRTLSFGEDNPGDENSPAVQTTNEKNKPGSVNRTLPFYERAGMEMHVPQDRIIGALMRMPAEDADSSRIQLLVENWLSFLKETETQSKLEDIYAGELQNFASQRTGFFPDIKNPVEAVRYGRIRFDDGIARMDIRLFSQTGRASGELVFTFQQGQWRILAENIDLGELEEEYQFPDYSARSELYGTFQM